MEGFASSLPPALQEAFGLAALNTIEGFLATELYAFAWVLLLGLYLAYAAAGMVADDVDRGRMDLLLALPVRRWRLVVEAYLSLLVPIAVLNVVVPVVVVVSTVAIGEPIALADLLAVHLLSIPYLLTAAGIGLLASVAVDRASVAQRAALAATFGLFLIDSVVSSTDFSALGALAPMRYYDPTAILVDGTYDFAGATILTVGAVVLVSVSAAWFERRDVN
jgi:ABC-2 type transport system permease protein